MSHHATDTAQELRKAIKRVTHILNERPPEGERRSRLLRERERLYAELADLEDDEPVDDEELDDEEPESEMIYAAAS